MSDLLPEDEALWRFVRDTAERVARSFDYRRISTPIVEDVRVFARTVGDDSDIVSKEMYVFEDRGGGRLALRPEGTAAVCRAYLEHGMASSPQPVRLYYFGPMFRYDRPQAGRYRQLWQFGAECIGDASPVADVEVIELQRTLFRELGLTDLVLRINSIGTAETRHAYVELLRRHFAPHASTLSHDSQRRLETNVLRVLDSKEDAEHPAVLEAPSILDHLTAEDAEHFAAVRSLLEAAGIAYEVDPRIVRGLDYYARTVWEFEPEGGGGQATVGAGGRYDGLIELLGGPPTPGTGFATGIERTVLNMRERDITTPDTYSRRPELYLVVASPTALTEALNEARAARSSGLSVVVGDPSRSVRAQMRHANQLAARYWAVIGQEERESKRVTLRDIVSGKDFPEPVPLDGRAVAADIVWGNAYGAFYAYLLRQPAPVDLDQEWTAPDWPQFVAALRSDGVLDGTATEALLALRDLRNQIVHGTARAETDTFDYFRKLASLVERLLS